MTSSHDYAHDPRTLLHIAEYLRECGVDPVDLFTRLGVPPSALLSADGWVPRELCFALGVEAAAATDDRFFGAKIGARYRLSELGFWGHLITKAANVDEACRVAAQTISLLHQGSKLRSFTLPSHAEFRLEYLGRLGANPSQHLIGTLVVLSKIVLLANVPEAISVRLSMPYSHGAECLEETLGPRLEFGCDHDAIVIERAILEAPISGSHSRTKAMGLESVGVISTVLKERLPLGRANIQAIAAQERISPRTLQRNLKAWGFTFEEVLSDVRRTEAIRLILSGEYSLTEIAFLLGYSDLPHFTRAFRRWTGRPPSDYAQVFRSSDRK